MFSLEEYWLRSKKCGPAVFWRKLSKPLDVRGRPACSEYLSTAKTVVNISSFDKSKRGAAEK